VKGYIAVSPPFGGSNSVLGALTSGDLGKNIPQNLLSQLVIPSPFDMFISRDDLMWYAARNMASLGMMAPNAAGYPGNPVSTTPLVEGNRGSYLLF
jgi:hypothetical protein